MPTRMLRDSIRTSPTLALLSGDEERLFIRLITEADDFGRFQADACLILASCFPRMVGVVTTKDVEAWYASLEKVDLVRSYVAKNGKKYGYFPTWEAHQQRRNKHSKYPAPPDDLLQIAADGGELQRNPLETRDTRDEIRESRREKQPAPVTQFFEAYFEAYTKRLGEAPLLDRAEHGKMAGVAASILKTVPIERIPALLAVFFNDPDPFFAGTGFSVEAFKGCLPKLQTKLLGADKTKPPSRPSGFA